MVVVFSEFSYFLLRTFPKQKLHGVNVKPPPRRVQLTFGNHAAPGLTLVRTRVIAEYHECHENDIASSFCRSSASSSCN